MFSLRNEGGQKLHAKSNTLRAFGSFGIEGARLVENNKENPNGI